MKNSQDQGDADIVEMPTELWRLTAEQMARAIRGREVSCREVVESCLIRLEEVNPKINAVIKVLDDEARALADEADKVLRSDEPLPLLHGVPVTIKDNVDQGGQATTNGTVAFKDNIVADDSSPVRNLRNAGAIIIGRTNLPSFAVRWFTDNELHGQTLNPWNSSVTPGGSSGGAAASLAAGITPLAHGNDAAGSIRYPAYACGVAGIRPTLGRVAGFNPSDVVRPRGLTEQMITVQGMLARRVSDLRFSFPALAARDDRDPWWVPVPIDLPRQDAPARVALFQAEEFHPDPLIVQGLNNAAAALDHAGYLVERAAPPHFAEITQLWLDLVMNEARHSFIPFLNQFADKKSKTAMTHFVELANQMDLAGVVSLFGRREQILREWIEFLQIYQIIVMPPSWAKPFPVDMDQRGLSEYRELVAAQSPNFAAAFLGLPALSVPAGIVNGTASGVQIVASRFREDLCFDAGEIIEKAVKVETPIEPRGYFLEGVIAKKGLP